MSDCLMNTFFLELLLPAASELQAEKGEAHESLSYGDHHCEILLCTLSSATSLLNKFKEPDISQGVPSVVQANNLGITMEVRKWKTAFTKTVEIMNTWLLCMPNPFKCLLAKYLGILDKWLPRFIF